MITFPGMDFLPVDPTTLAAIAFLIPTTLPGCISPIGGTKIVSFNPTRRDGEIGISIDSELCSERFNLDSSALAPRHRQIGALSWRYHSFVDSCALLPKSLPLHFQWHRAMAPLCFYLIYEDLLT